MDSPVVVKLWGERVGALLWDAGRGLASFQYDRDFIKSDLEISPLRLPLSNNIYRFPELKNTNTFQGLPGFIADSLPEKFGNRLLDTYLARHGKKLQDLTPLERLCYIGTRGMGALEYEPDFETRNLNKPIPLEVSDLVDLAQSVLRERESANASLNDTGMETLISVGTSAGGAKAKAIIAINDETNEVLSGQTVAPEGFAHWIIKFDEIENEELATSKQIGRIEYAYNEMAFDAGITIMECRLLHDGERAHFMSKRFDRVDGSRIELCRYDPS